MDMASIRYERLEATDKLEPADDDSNNNNTTTDKASSPSRRQPIWTRKQATLALLGNLVLLLTSICLLSVASRRRPSPSHLECAQKVSPYCGLNTILHDVRPCLKRLSLTNAVWPLQRPCGRPSSSGKATLPTSSTRRLSIAARRPSSASAPGTTSGTVSKPPVSRPRRQKSNQRCAPFR